MYITCSRKSDVTSKRFSKYLSRLIPDLKYIPRGKSNLQNIFQKSKYLSYNYLVLCSYNKQKIDLLIYKLNDNEYFPDRKYKITILDLRHLLSFKEIEGYYKKFNDLKKVFYFINKSYLSSKSEYGLYFLENNIFEFRYSQKLIGTKFKIENVEIFD
jgi:rRNA maturation protein Rpf1